MSDGNKSASSDESFQKLDMAYDEFDVSANDIDERELEIIGEEKGVPNLSAGTFSSTPFPADGHIIDRNSRYMIPLVCQWAGKPNECSVNVWFLVDTGSPFTSLTMKSLRAIFGEKKEIDVDARFDVAIQDQESVVQCQVSKGSFKEINLLGASTLRHMQLWIHGNWKKMQFKLVPQ